MADAKVVDQENVEAPAPAEAFHVMEVNDVAAMFETDVGTGLSSEEAATRLAKYGPNQLTEKRKRTIWEKIWDQISNVLVFILLVVAIISAVKGATSEEFESLLTNWIEFVLIIGVITLNTWIGIRQEGSAEKSAEALKAMLSSDATVFRDGKKTQVDASTLVIGDIVALSTGDRIPADLRLVRVANLASQEAALTGESLPVEKIITPIAAENPSSVPLGDRKNLAFSATLVAQGEGLGIVVKTGDNTEIGEINSLVSKVEKKKTNVLVQIDIVSRWIAAFVVVTAIVTFLVAFLAAGQEAILAVSTGLVTAVAMIPEGLAAIVTLTYAWAVSNMAKHNAIVRVLPAVETLGSVTVICSDKTGTLTMNLMSLVAFVTSDGKLRNDANATERKPENVVRDDEYMKKKDKKDPMAAKPATDAAPAEPADGAADGASDAAKEAVDAKDVNIQKEPEAEKASAIKNGSSPDVDYVRSALATGVLCSHSELGKDGGRDGEIGNPTEIAIVRAAYMAGVDIQALREQQAIINEVPFSSEYKFMATVHKAVASVDGTDEGLTVHAKGAIDRLLPLCSSQYRGGVISPDAVEPVNAEYWTTQAENMSSFGLRVLALTRATLPADAVTPDQSLDAGFVNGREGPWLTMVGLACILDPPRPECVDAIKEAHGAGVRVAMITGDHKATAVAIGEMLHIVSPKYPNAVTGPELDAMTDDELRVAVMSNNVFARASPENKIRIVKALQAEGQVSSMTGDGVNDAPALKAADMGVAMGKEGTDVAREAAEMILADDNFATIVRAVREGRVVWDNLRKVLLFNTPVNNAQGMTVLFGLIAGLPYSPLTPIQVLYCNLICAVTLGFVLAVEPAEDGIMKNPPRRVGKRLIGRYLLFRIAFATVVLVAFTVGAVFWVYNMPDEEVPGHFIGNNYPLTEADITDSGPCTVAVAEQAAQAALEDGSDSPECCPAQAAGRKEVHATDAQGSMQYFCCDSLIEVLNGGDNLACPDVPGRLRIRAQASNTLTLSAISVMFSARFAYNTAFAKRILFGNKYAWYSALIVIVLQLAITYIPGLNNIVFQMGNMSGVQWGICLLFVALTFILMEAEKMLMRSLKSKGVDTDDDKGSLFVATDDKDAGPFVPTDSQRSATMHNNLLHK